MVVAAIIATPYLMEAITERRKDKSDSDDQSGQDDWQHDDE